MVCCLHYATITNHSDLNLIDRHQFPWLTVSIGKMPKWGEKDLNDNEFDKNWLSISVTRKNRQMSIKVAQKRFRLKNDRF